MTRVVRPALIPEQSHVDGVENLRVPLCDSKFSARIHAVPDH
jgi:hypothetical protein